MDIARDLIGVAQHPVNAVVRGKWHPYFGKSAFDHTDIKTRSAIKRIESTGGRRTIFFEDGSHIDNVDNIILGTGYSWTLPFLPDFPVINNRLPGLYLHIFQRQDPTLAFVGAVSSSPRNPIALHIQKNKRLIFVQLYRLLLALHLKLLSGKLCLQPDILLAA